MKLKLKEEPREWLKFTAVMALVLAIAGLLLHWRKVVGREVLGVWIVVLMLALALCWIRPRWFRSFYRAGMTVSFRVGQIIGAVILTVFFLLIVTPLGLFLRMLGKDLLRLKRDTAATTYWQPGKATSQLDRQF